MRRKIKKNSQLAKKVAIRRRD